MEAQRKMALRLLAGEFKTVVDDLEEDPLKKARALITADDNIKDLIRKDYRDIPDAVFLQFFYSLIRYHIWMHIAADVSSRISDNKIEGILNAVKIGLNNLAEALERDDKIKMYDALVELVFSYLNELNKRD